MSLNAKIMEDQIRWAQATEHGRGGIDLLSSPSISRARAVEILTSPEIMADFFQTSLSWILPEGSIVKECRPRVLRDRFGSRQVVSYRIIFLDDADRNVAPMKLVLKRYADKAEGKKTYSTMRTLWENGFNRESKLRISKPFCYLEELGLLVLEKAHGLLLRRNLNQSGPVAMTRMKAVARWLAKLHCLDADFEEISPHPNEKTSIRDFVRQAGGREHRLFSSRLEELASLIPMKLSAFKNVSMTPVHGDFQCENIFVDYDRVTVVDFDKFCRSDPARDVGYLIAQMRAMALLGAVPPGFANAELKAFWEEYLDAASVEESGGLSARASLFAARKCLQNIYYMSYVLPGEGIEIVSALLKEAVRFVRADRVEEVLELPILP